MNPGESTVPLLQDARDRSFVMEGPTGADIQIRAVRAAQRNLLTAMYEEFDPLGVAFGLPPHSPEARSAWISSALGHRVNIGAFSASGEAVGHCFLACSAPESAELAVFVHQESRRRGVGTALVKAALRWGAAAGLRRIWSMTAADNRAALRLQKSCGFRQTKFFPDAELEIDLPAGMLLADSGFRI